jgi:hypothetical protein
MKIKCCVGLSARNIFSSFHQILLKCETQEDEIGQICSMNGDMICVYKLQSKNENERDLYGAKMV